MISTTLFEEPKRTEKGLKSGVFRKQNRFHPFADKGEKTMIYGYARCSTNEDKQDINRQIRELKAMGVEEVIFLPYPSGL